MSDTDNPVRDIIKPLAESQKRAYEDNLVREHVRNRTKFDVFMAVGNFPDVGLYLARRVFHAPIVLFTPGIRWTVSDRAMHSVANPAILPSQFLRHASSMDFLQRLKNTLMYLYVNGVVQLLLIPHLNDATRELLGLEESPDLSAIHQSAAFHFRNSHAVFEDNAPVNPNTVRVAGMQTRPAKPVEDRKLGDWLDGAEGGLIYISFGTVSI